MTSSSSQPQNEEFLLGLKFILQDKASEQLPLLNESVVLLSSTPKEIVEKKDRALRLLQA